MKELVQNILVYVVIVSVLRGLITNPRYSQYFQFFSGVIMLLLMLAPILSFFQYENQWYEMLEEKILQMDLSDVESEMEIAGDRFAAIIKQEYQETAEKQIVGLAAQKGITVEEASVSLQGEGEEWEIAEISVKLGDAPKENVDFSVETAQIEEGQQDAWENTSKAAKSLQKQICNYFVIGKDKVHIH